MRLAGKVAVVTGTSPNIGAGIAHILPGTFLAQATKGAAYTYPYVVLNFLDGARQR